MRRGLRIDRHAVVEPGAQFVRVVVMIAKLRIHSPAGECQFSHKPGGYRDRRGLLCPSNWPCPTRISAAADSSSASGADLFTLHRRQWAVGGLMPDLAPVESGDFHFVDAADAEEGMRKLLAIVRERIRGASGSIRYA